jgi:hypothetical protein
MAWTFPVRAFRVSGELHCGVEARDPTKNKINVKATG